MKLRFFILFSFVLGGFLYTSSVLAMLPEDKESGKGITPPSPVKPLPASELEEIKTSMEKSRGQTRPVGWKVEEESYSSQIIDNTDGSGDSRDFLTQTQIEGILAAASISPSSMPHFSVGVKSLNKDSIECVLQVTQTDMGCFHYFFTKKVTLKRTPSKSPAEA